MLTLLKQSYVPCITGHRNFSIEDQNKSVADAGELSSLKELISSFFSLNSSGSLISLLRSVSPDRNTLVNLKQGLKIDLLHRN